MTNNDPAKEIRQLRWLLTFGLIFTGLLAGETVDRFVVGLPAWRHVNILSWAEYSRNADLGSGIFVYPVEAIGSFFLFSISSFILIKNKRNPAISPISLPVHLSTLSALAGLILTFCAGPFMLSIRHTNDPELLQFAFDHFYYWSIFRGVAQVFSFLFCILATEKAFTISIETQKSG